jgi:hypothetical protein
MDPGSRVGDNDMTGEEEKKDSYPRVVISRVTPPQILSSDYSWPIPGSALNLFLVQIESPLALRQVVAQPSHEFPAETR